MLSSVKMSNLCGIINKSSKTFSTTFTWKI